MLAGAEKYSVQQAEQIFRGGFFEKKSIYNTYCSVVFFCIGHSWGAFADILPAAGFCPRLFCPRQLIHCRIIQQ